MIYPFKHEVRFSAKGLAKVMALFNILINELVVKKLEA
jgi:hypothetical protein